MESLGTNRLSDGSVPNPLTPGTSTGNCQEKFSLLFRGCWALGSQANRLKRLGKHRVHTLRISITGNKQYQQW